MNPPVNVVVVPVAVMKYSPTFFEALATLNVIPAKVLALIVTDGVSALPSSGICMKLLNVNLPHS